MMVGCQPAACLHIEGFALITVRYQTTLQQFLVAKLFEGKYKRLPEHIFETRMCGGTVLFSSCTLSDFILISPFPLSLQSINQARLGTSQPYYLHECHVSTFCAIGCWALLFVQYTYGLLLQLNLSCFHFTYTCDSCRVRWMIRNI